MFKIEHDCISRNTRSILLPLKPLQRQFTGGIPLLFTYGKASNLKAIPSICKHGQMAVTNDVVYRKSETQEPFIDIVWPSLRFFFAFKLQ